MSAVITIILIVWGVYYFSRWFISKGLPWLLMWLMKHQARKQYEQMFGQQPGPSSSQGQQRKHSSPFSRQRQPEARRRPRGKIITKDMGEYVDFEDIPTYTSQSQPHDEPKKKYPDEPQITDADWEDL